MFQIHCGNDIEYPSVSKEIFSTLFVECNDIAFPVKEWTDFSVTVLGWWVNSLKTAVTHGEDSFQLLFEDGPWRLDVVAIDGSLELHGFDDVTDGRECCCFSVSYREFVTALHDAVIHLRECIAMANIKCPKEMVRLARIASTLENLYDTL